MFAEGCIYSQPSAVGVRCLVMRRWPRGIAHDRVDVWLKDLGPLPELMDRLQRGQLTFGAFAQQYTTQLMTHPATQEALRQLIALEASSGTVILLCHELTYPCHRFVLLDYLTNCR